MGNLNDFILKELEKRFPNYLKMGDECLVRKDYRRALEFYQKAEAAQGSNPYLHYNWAACFFALEEYDAAITRFKIAVKLKPDFTDAYINWGITLMNKHRLREAVKKFKQASKIAPDDPKVYLNMGIVLEMLEYPEDAEENFLKVLEKTSPTQEHGDLKASNERIIALNKLALLDMKKDKLQEAINKFQQIVKIDPKFAPAYYNLAIVHANTGKDSKAIENLAKAIDYDGSAFRRAKEEPAFKKLQNNEAFKKLIP
jgi:tetratricopeptide (TPR) repeat protein